MNIYQPPSHDWRAVTKEWSPQERRRAYCGGPWHVSLQTALDWAKWLHDAGYTVYLENMKKRGSYIAFNEAWSISDYLAA